MAILSEYEEEDQKKPTTSSVKKVQFNGVLDPSDPIGFLERVFEFVARESDLFKSDSLVNDVNAVVRMVKDKVEAEEKKRTKELKAKENVKAEKKAKEEEPVAAAVQTEVVKETVAEKKVDGEAETKEEEKKGPRGISH